MNNNKHNHYKDSATLFIIAFVVVCLLATIALGGNSLSKVSSSQNISVIILTCLCAVACIAIGVLALNYRKKLLGNDDELNEQREQYFLQEKMASLGQMIAGVAHEINTPLAYVMNNVELMHRCLKGISSDVMAPVEELKNIKSKTIADILVNQRKMISAVRSNDYPKKLERALDLSDDAENGLDSISELVATLKDFSRIDRQQEDHASIHELIDLTLKITERHTASNHVKITRIYDQKLPLILCQPSKLNQVFLNLIVNACHAIIGGGKLTISTMYDAEKKSIFIKFTDDGMGMSRKTQRSLFDPFYTTKEVGSGSGLGMSIVSSIIKEHEGIIDVHSNLGKGTVFSIMLPLKKSSHSI